MKNMKEISDRMHETNWKCMKQTENSVVFFITLLHHVKTLSPLNHLNLYVMCNLTEDFIK